MRIRRVAVVLVMVALLGPLWAGRPSLRAQEEPVLQVSPTSLSFAGQAGGKRPKPQFLTLTNAGGGLLHWTASTDAEWVLLGGKENTIGPGQAIQLLIWVDSDELEAGEYKGKVTIAAEGVQGSPVVVEVTLTLTDPPRLEASPTSLSFQAQEGGDNPGAKTLTIKNAGGQSLNWAVSTAAPWLILRPSQGSLTKGNSQDVSVEVDLTGLNVGSHQAQITVASPEAVNSPLDVPVTLTITERPNQPPTAAFSFSPSNPKTGDAVSFDASGSSDPDGVIESYNWDFGDGTTGSGRTATHAFSAARSYTVRLTVTDDRGAAAFTSRTVTVRVLTPPPAGMVLVPAGSFQMGDSFGEGNSDELPVHNVNVSAFYMDKFEVTKAVWDEVAAWAAGHGYDIGPDDGSGQARNHPVQRVSWYEAVKWANARSEKEELTPCYYTNSGQTTVYRRGQVDVKNEWVKWKADCYRLPTEAEWEKAARGGAERHRFPWSDTDTVDKSRANYLGGNGESYDRGGERGNPSCAASSSPRTCPVGSFAANGYGLYDMAGNVFEWNWDWFNSDYYSISPRVDPRGPASGSGRVLRGGSWTDVAIAIRVAFRGGGGSGPGGSGLNVGFRLVRAAASLP